MTPAPDYTERWAKIGRGENISPPDLSMVPKFNYYSPLVKAADDYVHWAQTPNERIYLGFAEIDEQMKGIAPSELCLINGYSHSGKTLALLQILVANRDKRVVYFCPDEPRTLTLIKLACVTHGLDANEFEQQIASGNSASINLLRETANEYFPNLAVFDQTVSLIDMERALAEIEIVMGDPQLIVVDYLDLITGGGEDVPSKANSIKAFGKRHNVPLLVLHQASRTSGADGKKQTISSGAYGGEQQATHIIGVRRKRFEIEGHIRDLQEKLDRATNTERIIEKIESLQYDLRIHMDTVTLNLVKCKRPASQLLDDMDFSIEYGTGRLHRLETGVLPWKDVQPSVDNPTEQLTITDALEDW
jgi:KaiC/GvpD/RAD55 family RecA-like ATPase